MIDCPCGELAYRSPFVKLMAPPIYTFNCPWCEAQTEINGVYTNEHWPEEVKEELKKIKEEWAKNPGPPVVYEGEPIVCVCNESKGIAVVKI